MSKFIEALPLLSPPSHQQAQGASPKHPPSLPWLVPRRLSSVAPSSSSPTHTLRPSPLKPPVQSSSAPASYTVSFASLPTTFCACSFACGPSPARPSSCDYASPPACAHCRLGHRRACRKLAASLSPRACVDAVGVLDRVSYAAVWLLACLTEPLPCFH